MVQGLRLAELLFTVAGRSPSKITLLAPKLTLQALRNLNSFAVLPHHRVRGRVASVHQLKTALRNAPMEFMLSTAKRDADVLFLARWPSTGDHGSLNIRWRGVAIQPWLLTWLETAAAMLERRRGGIQADAEAGHFIATFREGEPGVTRSLGSAALAIVGQLQEHPYLQEEAMASWTGEIGDVEQLIRDGTLERCDGFPDFLGFLPAGVPEENVDRRRLQELCTFLQENVGSAELWLDGLELVSNAVPLRAVVAVKRRKDRTKVELDTERPMSAAAKKFVRMMAQSTPAERTH